MSGTNMQALGMVVITDYVAANTGRDVSAEIQKVIDEHPQRTIYFPDGEYILGHPICTSSNPKNAVALQLANFAVLKAADDWSDPEAMVRLGASEHFNTITVNGSNYYFCGGIIDGNMKANGIAIESGRETSIRNVSIKHTFVGLHIKFGANFGSSDADVETVNIVGNNKKGSIGVLLEGYDNTLTNMRIYAVQTGVMLKSGGNFLRNVHPLFCYGYEGADPTEIDYADSVAFHDFDHTNWYDYCYSDQMATGFRLAVGNRATLMNCFAMWYWKDSQEVAIACDGRFDATVTNIKVNFREDTTNNALLRVGEEGGNGLIENPIINAQAITDKTYEKYVVGRIM